MKDVKGKKGAIIGFTLYLDYIIRSETNKLLKENPAWPEDPRFAEQLALSVATRLTEDYRKHSPGIVKLIGKELKRRLKT